MNVGALIVLVEFLKGIEKGEAFENGGKTYEIKPNCPIGTYAYKEPLSGKYSCLKIPTGR